MGGNDFWGIIKAFFKAIFQELILLVLIFAVTTGIAALVCWFYGAPIWLSLIGGFVSIGVVYVFKTDSLFD